MEQGQHNNDSLLDETMAYSLNRFLRGERSFRIDDTISFTNNFSSAFAMARTKNSDYFIQLSYKERSNSFTLIADLYLSSSGKKLKTFSYLRTGNNRIFKTLENFASDLNSTFPVIGVIKQIKNNQILTDIGFRDGINTNDDFIIIRNKNIKPDANDFLFKYETSALLGRVKIIQVNESTSSGSIEDDFSNLNAINIGDYIVELPTEEIDKEKIKDHYFLDTELLEQLLLVN